MYGKHRVPPYQPDVDDSENLIDLVVELHISAARAFKLKQLEPDHMSEEWMSRLRSVEGTVRHIKAIVGPRTFGNPSFAISTDAIWGMTQLELSRVSRANGSYADAIHYLDQASTSYISALDEIEYEPSEAFSVDRYGRNTWGNTLNWDDETIKSSEVID